MENLTHCLAGWQIGQLSPFRGVGPRAGLVGLVAANLPDLDVLLYAWDRDVATWQHRGLTHSIFGLPLLALSGAALSRRWLGTGRFRDHLALWSAGLLSHSLMDWPTTWGTQLLWPLSDQRFDGALVFIIDPMFWILLGVAPWLLVWALGWSRANAATLALLSVAGWYAAAAGLKELATSRAPEPVIATPAPLAPWQWTGVTPDVPADPERRRYFLTPLAAEPAGRFRALDTDTRALLSRHHAVERDLWMRVAPAVHHDEVTPRGREVAVVDLAYTSWLTPDHFRFGCTYVLDDAGALLDRNAAPIGP